MDVIIFYVLIFEFRELVNLLKDLKKIGSRDNEIFSGSISAFYFSIAIICVYYFTRSKDSAGDVFINYLIVAHCTLDVVIIMIIKLFIGLKGFHPNYMNSGNRDLEKMKLENELENKKKEEFYEYLELKENKEKYEKGLELLSKIIVENKIVEK